MRHIRANLVALWVVCALAVVLPRAYGQSSATISGHGFELKDYQTLAVGLCAFTIGILTVLNAFISNFIANRKHKRDLEKEDRERREKLSAYFSILETDISHVISSIESGKIIIQSLLDDDIPSSTWLYAVKSAKISIRFGPITRDWEKIYIIGHRNISLLRKLEIAMNELERSFEYALEAVSKRRRYDPVGAGQPGQIVIRRVCEDLTRERCGPRPPAGIIAGLGYAMEAT